MKVNDMVKSHHLNLKLILSLFCFFVKMFQMPYMSLQQANTFMGRISMFWVFFLINFSICGVCVCVCVHARVLVCV